MAKPDSRLRGRLSAIVDGSGLTRIRDQPADSGQNPEKLMGSFSVSVCSRLALHPLTASVMINARLTLPLKLKRLSNGIFQSFR